MYFKIHTEASWLLDFKCGEYVNEVHRNLLLYFAQLDSNVE